jgi:rare lipoprotein A
VVPGEFVAAASFAEAAEANALAAALAPFGKPVVESADAGGRTVYAVSLYPDGRLGIDAMLEQAWRHGAPDAISVRD